MPAWDISSALKERRSPDFPQGKRTSFVCLLEGMLIWSPQTEVRGRYGRSLHLSRSAYSAKRRAIQGTCVHRLLNEGHREALSKLQSALHVSGAIRISAEARVEKTLRRSPACQGVWEEATVMCRTTPCSP